MRACLPAILVFALSSAGCGDNTASEASAAGGQCDKLEKVENAEFCAEGAPAVDCSIIGSSQTNALCGVPLKDGPEPLARATGLKEFSGSGAPAVGCFAPSG